MLRQRKNYTLPRSAYKYSLSALGVAVSEYLYALPGSKMIKKTLNSGFGHIKYDEKYMPELFLTLPELQNEQDHEFLTISKRNIKNTTGFPNQNNNNRKTTTTKTRHFLNAPS